MSFKICVITPKSELKNSLGSSDWSFLLTESVTFYSGNAFGHYFTGEGFFLRRTIPDVGMSLEEGRTEWIKILYLSYYSTVTVVILWVVCVVLLQIKHCPILDTVAELYRGRPLARVCRSDSIALCPTCPDRSR